MSTYGRKTNFVEGIGNEVLLAFTAFCAVFVSLFIYVHKRQNERMHIHPDSAASVETTRQQLRQEQQRPPRTPRDNSSALECPVCLAEAVFAVETNCGHRFCGHCIITYWKSGQRSVRYPVACPVCRTQVTILLHHFSSEEMATSTPQRETIEADIALYNRRFSGEPVPLMDRIRDAPTLIRHAWSEFFTWEGMISIFRARVIFCFILAFMYFLSPLDIIPESLFGIFGYLDDLFIILSIAIYISILYRNLVSQRAQNALRIAPE